MGWVWKERHSWRGSYRDEAGKQHTKSFKRQGDAKRWISTEEAKVVRGDWIDPAAGKVTFAAFYATWAPRQVWLSSTRENAASPPRASPSPRCSCGRSGARTSRGGSDS